MISNGEDQKSQEKNKAVLYDIMSIPEQILKSGLTRRLIVGENEMLAYFVVKKGTVASPHKHESEQITLVLKGAIRFSVEGEEYLVREGGVLVIPPNVEHSGVALEDSIDVDCFSPLRNDWVSGKDDYLRKNQEGRPRQKPSSVENK